MEKKSMILWMAEPWNRCPDVECPFLRYSHPAGWVLCDLLWVTPLEQGWAWCPPEAPSSPNPNPNSNPSLGFFGILGVLSSGAAGAELKSLTGTICLKQVAINYCVQC